MLLCCYNFKQNSTWFNSTISILYITFSPTPPYFFRFRCTRRIRISSNSDFTFSFKSATNCTSNCLNLLYRKISFFNCLNTISTKTKSTTFIFISITKMVSINFTKISWFWLNHILAYIIINYISYSS